ncbi:hypothetical protein HYH02_000776 [Chlamydomonas schloesseri]|uniref:Ion transport domain-containing protein n=1 Tax=Chlamydomonas schloesseri TaxID=2026947 RepID=A0A835WV92_9CHLO|nr:hypothetical protein HYH02_000776 [Chlamydomonas schloesseri]|eukprot:KAG2454948.1 hypothetical protein HYH02_000776 [Chlamydomonas schloesseri]
MVGVAMALYSLYRGRDISGMDSFWEVMLALFRTFLGETIFDTFSEETSTLYVVYANVLIVLYAVAATVVLANLLIALISSHFQADRAAAQSRLQRAQMIRYYSFLLLGVPFSLPLLLVTEPLPSGLRPWAGDYAEGWKVVKALPMDGLPMPTETRKERRYPKGGRELPYVIYLLAFYPAVMALTWAMWVALAPYCLAYFTLYGYRNWLEVLRPKRQWAKAQSKEKPTSATPNGKRSSSLLGMVLRAPFYIVVLPLWLLLGLLLYVGGLGGLPVLLWGGVYQWLWRVAYYSHWVVRGWVEGWHDWLRSLRAAERQERKQAEEEEADVGLQSARRLDKPPALSPADIRAAMRDAGLSEGDVALAVRGAAPDWEQVENDAEDREQLWRAGKGTARLVAALVNKALVEAGVHRR